MEHPARQAQILVVDDAAQNLELIGAILKDLYRVQVALDGARALALCAAEPKPDLILLDVVMSGIDGYEVCRRLKADPVTMDIPVIFLTSESTTASEQKGLDLGAVDYISKPVSAPILRARVKAPLTLKTARDLLKNQNVVLEAEVRERTRKIEVIQDATIIAMASLAETRDNETGNHLRRTQHYVKALAEKMRAMGKGLDVLTDECIRMLFKSAPLHDIGKVGIPDRILLKPGKLTPEEFEIMKTHTTLGAESIRITEALIGEQTTFLQLAHEIALSHQEKWDGSGYPEGLRGDQIPLSARLMAVADVYDALISRRVYKPPMPHDQAVEIIIAGRGKHFDPDIVDAFIAIQGDMQVIAERYGDSEEDVQKKAGLG
jgi:putative two-component system response regulator